MNDETMNVRMELAFPERRREDLERLNALLGSVNWSSVQYSDFEGYHAECKEYAADSGEVCSVTIGTAWTGSPWNAGRRRGSRAIATG